MGLTVKQVKDADTEPVLKAAKAWDTQVTELKKLLARYQKDVEKALEESDWEGPSYTEAQNHWRADRIQLQRAEAQADAIRLALQMAAADIDAAQEHLRGGLEKAAGCGAKVAPDGSLQLPPVVGNDPESQTPAFQRQLAEGEKEIKAALRMANTADERIAWDLRDDTGPYEDAFNERARKGRRIGPDEILRKYRVTDDPQGMTTYFGESVTHSEKQMLKDLSATEKLEFKKIKERATEEAAARFPEDNNDGHRDAFRHAYWNALMAQKFGVEWAEEYGTAHERLPGNPADREAMDLYNNEVGRNVAVNNPWDTGGQLADKVQNAVDSGTTVVMDGDGDLMPSDKVEIGEHGNSDKVPGDPDAGEDPGDPGKAS